MINNDWTLEWNAKKGFSLTLAPVKMWKGGQGWRWRASVALFSSLCCFCLFCFVSFCFVLFCFVLFCFVFCFCLFFFYQTRFSHNVFLYLGVWMVNHGWKGNLKKWNRKNVQLLLSLSSSELKRFNNFSFNHIIS